MSKTLIHDCNASIGVNNHITHYYSSNPLNEIGNVFVGGFSIYVFLVSICFSCILSTIFGIYTRTTYKLKNKWSMTTITLLILSLCCFSSFINGIINIIKIKRQVLKIPEDGRPCVKDNIIYNKDDSATLWNDEIHEKYPQPTYSPLIKSEI